MVLVVVLVVVASTPPLTSPAAVLHLEVAAVTAADGTLEFCYE